jgi:hypothetical protein
MHTNMQEIHTYQRGKLIYAREKKRRERQNRVNHKKRTQKKYIYINIKSSRSRHIISLA